MPRPPLHRGATFLSSLGLGRTYILTHPLVHRTNQTPNVWKAFDAHSPNDTYVLKGPRDESKKAAWDEFRREVAFQKMFRETGARFVRGLVDLVRLQQPCEEGMGVGEYMVLEPFEKTLWMARLTRGLSRREIKWVMRGSLMGLREIHERGLVHCDFKGENVLLDGFDDERPLDESKKEPININVKVSDLGTLMPPGQGTITSITYRSPEAYLGKPWSYTTDVWSWGVLFFHLLQARHDFSSPGIYDALIKGGTRQDAADAVLVAMCDDFDLRSMEYFRDCEFPASAAESGERRKKMDWRERLLRQGVEREDVEFLTGVIQPDPRRRMGVEEILGTGYLDVD